MISESADQQYYQSIKGKNIDLFHLGRSSDVLDKGQFVKSSSHSNISKNTKSFGGGSLKSMKSVSSAKKEDQINYPINIETKSGNLIKEASKDFTKINYQDFTNTEDSK